MRSKQTEPSNLEDQTGQSALKTYKKNLKQASIAIEVLNIFFFTHSI